MKTLLTTLLLLFVLITTAQKTVTLAYYSPVDATLTKQLAASIMETYNCNVRLYNQYIPLPAHAYYAPRNRYKADKLLGDLRRYQKTDYIVGVTNKDISTSAHGYADWGIMGIATDGVGVVSSYRMKTKSTYVFNERMIKVVLHELGHTMGLNHCTETTVCVMYEGDRTAKGLDGETRLLCNNCRKLLNQK